MRKLVIWMNIPSHHQQPFFKALHADPRIDLQVVYFQHIAERRQEEGWVSPELRPGAEFYYSEFKYFNHKVPDWRERTHIIGGTFRSSKVLALIRKLLVNKVDWYLWSEAPYLPIGWKRKVKSVLTFPIKKLMVVMINKRAKGLFVISHNARNAFKKLGVNPGKIYFLPYSVEKQNVSESDEVKRTMGQPLTFGYLGTLSYLKGTDILLRAFAIIAQEYANCQLMLTGKLTKDLPIQKLMDTLGIRNRVILADSVKSTEIEGVYRQMDVFLLPSRYDGWGMVLSEAAAHGIALISSLRAGAAYHLIEEGRNGFLFQPGSVRSLANTMSNYCRQPELVSKHGSESLRMISRFSAPANVERLLETLQDRPNP